MGWSPSRTADRQEPIVSVGAFAEGAERCTWSAVRGALPREKRALGLGGAAELAKRREGAANRSDGLCWFPGGAVGAVGALFRRLPIDVILSSPGRSLAFRRRWTPGHRQSRHPPRTSARSTTPHRATNVELLFSVISRGSVGSFVHPRPSAHFSRSVMQRFAYSVFALHVLRFLVQRRNEY